MTPDEIRRDKETRLRAVAEARGYFETLVRLAELENEHRSLTSRQEDDRDEARARYNRLAAGLGLPEIRAGTDWTSEDWQTVKAQLYGTERRWQAEIEKDDRSRELVRSMPSWMVDGSLYDRDSGLPAGARSSADPIRSMLDAHEGQADFAFPDSEAIRQIRPLGFDDETRAISDFATGSALYVNDFAARVVAYARTASPWIGIATVQVSNNGRPLVIPNLTADVTGYTPGEGTAITPSDPTLGTATALLVSYKALTYVSAEAAEDEDINLTDVVARSHARELSLRFGSAATTAILAGITNGGTATGTGGNGTATASFVGYEDLIDLVYSAPAPYRSGASWVASGGMIKKARKYKDAQGAYLWPSADLASAQPPALLGAPVYEDPYLAAPASATKSVIYGDGLAGLLIKASPLRVAVSTDYLFSTDQIAIKSVHRLALAIPDPLALRYLVSANT